MRGGSGFAFCPISLTKISRVRHLHLSGICNQQQTAGVGVHSGVFELVGVHLAKALKQLME